jgi:eukaryotic-like serine/threonine-protein kinase
MKRGIVVGAAGAAIMVVGLAGCSSHGSSTSSTSSPSTTTTPQTGESSLQQLQQLAAGDRPFVSAQLVGHWIPLLSSKHSTQPWTYDTENHVTYDSQRILQEHLQLRQQYGAKLLRSGDWSAFDKPDYWVTVAPVGFSDAASVQGWCTSHARDADHCSAKLLST